MDILLSNFIMTIKHCYNNDRGSKVANWIGGRYNNSLCRLDARDSALPRGGFGACSPKKNVMF